MNKTLFFVLFLALVSCEETVVTGFQDKPVVESYLYADESPTVKVSKLIAFDSDMVYSGMDINNLEVIITETNSQKKYTLTNTGEGIYGNKDFVVSAGSSYKLSIPYNGQEVSAITLVPQKPTNVTLSATTIAIPQMGQAGSGEMAEMPPPVEIDWSNNDQSYYLVYVKNVESVKVPVNSKSPAGKDFFRNQPTTSNHYELNARSFQFYGLHRIILYKIQPEYVLFFQETSNNSQSISEIRANVENGMGIFTGINSVSTYLYVGTP
jgi:hypothetical protein